MSRNRAVTMVGIAVLFGGLSILAADMWLKSQAEARIDRPTPATEIVAQAPPVETTTIVVADEPLRFGASLASAGLKEIPWHQEAVPAGAYGSIREALADGERIVISPIEPNEPILLAKLSGPNGRATLSNRLTPGMRAVTIRIDEIAGVGGLVAPGDHVDVVLTRDAGNIEEVNGNAGGAAGSTIASEVVVENVRVLSVGQALDERRTEPQLASSVTIEVSTEGARKVALARNIGTLSLSLRSITDSGSAGSGLTTISSFGGSARGKENSDGGVGSGLLEAITPEPRGPAQRTIIVTRGTVAKSYQVIAPEDR